MTKVKICGITNLEDARLASDLGADALGFNFFPGSKRYIEKGEAASIIEQLKDPITKVGVFVDQTLEEILESLETAEIDIVQFHGSEPPALIEDLKSETGVKIMKAFRVSPKSDRLSINDYDVDWILLDTYSGIEFGGTGQVFDWEIAKSIERRGESLYLAGGLTADNVADAIRQVRPYAVDVASGVESRPGKKDPARVAAFIKAAKEAI